MQVRFHASLSFVLLATAFGFIDLNYLDYGELRAWQIAEGIRERRGIALAGFYLLTYCACVAALVCAVASTSRGVRAGPTPSRPTATDSIHPVSRSTCPS